jgi:hypothetical protein
MDSFGNLQSRLPCYSFPKGCWKIGNKQEIGNLFEAFDEGTDVMDEAFIEFQTKTTLSYINFLSLMTECHRSTDHPRINNRLVGVMKDLLLVFEEPALNPGTILVLPP